MAVVAEGFCPKLEVTEVAGKPYLLYGTYGLEAVTHSRSNIDHALRDPILHPRQAIVDLSDGKGRRADGLLEGLPRDGLGFVDGDLEMGGGGKLPPWLVRTQTVHGGIGGGAMFSRQHDYYAWRGGRWEIADGRPTIAPSAPDVRASKACAGTGHELDVLVQKTVDSGERFAVVACVDDKKRQVRILLGAYSPRAGAWTLSDAPVAHVDAALNAGIVVRGPDDVYVHAWAPYERGDGTPFLVHFDGARWTVEPGPSPMQTTSLAAEPDGTVWAVARWSEVRRRPPGAGWQTVALPDPLLVKTRPPKLSVLAVQVVLGKVYVHAAYGVEVGGEPERVHVLYGPSLAQPLQCDKREPLVKSMTVMAPRP